MTCYTVWLHDRSEITVEGDRLEVVGQTRSGAGQGDLLIRKDGHTVAHFRAEGVVGYHEIPSRLERVGWARSA